MRNMLINEMSKSGGKVKYLCGGSMPNISPDIEFYKWLSYEPIFEKENKEYLNSVLPTSLTIEQLEQLKRYKEFNVYRDIFTRYAFGKEVTSQEYKLICSFMQKNNIYSVAKYKLTSEEIKVAQERAIELFSTMSQKECSEYLNSRRTSTNQEVYLQMSMIDSLVFHLISDMSLNRGLKRLNSEIDSQIKANERMRQRSYYNASNPYRK